MLQSIPSTDPTPPTLVHSWCSDRIAYSATPIHPYVPSDLADSLSGGYVWGAGLVFVGPLIETWPISRTIHDVKLNRSYPHFSSHDHSSVSLLVDPDVTRAELLAVLVQFIEKLGGERHQRIQEAIRAGASERRRGPGREVHDSLRARGALWANCEVIPPLTVWPDNS